MDPSSSISSELAIDEQAVQVEITTRLKSELYKAAFNGNLEAFDAYQGSLHCLMTPNQNTVLHVHLASPDDGTGLIIDLFPFLCCYFRFPAKSLRSTNFVEQILNRSPSLLLKPNAKGEIPLHIAARFGKVNIVELLIKHAKAEHRGLENGIEPAKQMLRMTDNEKNTALHKAVRYGHVEVVHALIQEDPDFSYSVNKSRETPLYIAARRGYNRLVTLIFDKCEFANHDGPCGRTALHAAVMDHNITEHRGLENGIEPAKQMLRMTDNEKNTALHKAVRYGHVEVVHALIQEDPDFSYSVNKSGETPLYIAAKRGYNRLVTLIFDKCEFANHDGPCGRTALHAAVMDHNITEHRGLENGIEPAKQMLRMTDNEKNTALHKAVRYGHVEVVHALIQEDPDFSYSVNKSGETPLYIAARRGYDRLVRMILDRCESSNHDGPCGRTALHAAVMSFDIKSTGEILKKRKNLRKAADENGQTPLHYAAHFGYDRIVKLLLESNKLYSCRRFLDEEDIHGNTPLQVLAASRDLSFWIGHTFKDDVVTVSKENLDSKKKEQISQLLNEVSRGEVAGVSVCPLLHNSIDLERFDKAREARSFVAGLIATVTFAAAITLPGGYYSDQGTAILSHNTAFKVFVIADAIAMVFSLLAINLNYLSALPIAVAKRRLSGAFPFSLMSLFSILSEVALVIAFVASLYAVLKSSLTPAISACTITPGFYYFYLWLRYCVSLLSY
ncbi:hypothetical protein SCA6_016145 [Theobroma cacao]